MLLSHLPHARDSFCHEPFSVLAPEGAKPRHFSTTWAFSHPPVLRPISFSIKVLHHTSPPRKGPERPSFSLSRIFYRNPAMFPTLRPRRQSMSTTSSQSLGCLERRELSLRAGKAEAWLQHSIPEHHARTRDTMTSWTVVQGMTGLDCFLTKIVPRIWLSSHVPNCRFQISHFGLEGETAEDTEIAEGKEPRRARNDFGFRIADCGGGTAEDTEIAEGEGCQIADSLRLGALRGQSPSRPRPHKERPIRIAAEKGVWYHRTVKRRFV